MLLMMMMIQSPKGGAMVFATVPDERKTNYVSPVGTRFQPDIQSLPSSALLSNQSLAALRTVGPYLYIAEVATIRKLFVTRTTSAESFVRPN